MSREYARRSRGGGNLPLIILVVGAIIVISVVAYFVFFRDSGSNNALDNSDIVEAVPTVEAATETPGPVETASPTPAPTMEIVLPVESLEVETAAPTPTPTPVKTYQSATIWSNKSNVRDNPSLTNSTVIGSVRYGETYKVHDESSKFVKIQMSNGAFGWVHTAYIVRGSAAVPAAPTSVPADSLVKSSTLASDASSITITFTGNAYGSSTTTDFVNIPMDAFTVKQGTVSKLTSVSACSGGTAITLYLSGATAGAETTLTVDGNKIYDNNGEDSGYYSNTFNSGADVSAPTVDFTGTATSITVTFSEGVYDTASGSGALETGDFSIDASGSAVAVITGISHNAGSSTATITATCSVDATVTITLIGGSVWDAAGNPCGADSGTFTYTA